MPLARRCLAVLSLAALGLTLSVVSWAQLVSPRSEMAVRPARRTSTPGASSFAGHTGSAPGGSILDRLASRPTAGTLGTPSILSGWATGAPTVDGTLAPGEWADATVLDITIGASPVVLYVMNGGGALYLALDCQEDPTPDLIDYLAIDFDDEGGTPPLIGDGTWNAASCPATEGAVVIGNLAASGSLADNVFLGQTPTGGCPEVVATGVSGAYSAATGHMVYEMTIDLATSELHALPGQTFYAYFEAYDGNLFNVVGAFPAGVDYADPSTFALLTLATPPQPSIASSWATSAPTLDGTLAPGEWDAATTLDITTGASPVLLHVMNDAGVLYLALDCQADLSLSPLDYFAIAFEDEGGTPPLLADGLWNAVTCPSTEGFVGGGNLATAGFPSDIVFQGQTSVGLCPLVSAAGVAGAYSDASGHMVYEMALDLAASPLHALPGQTFHAYFENVEGNSVEIVGAFPDTPDVFDPTTFALLTLATEPGVVLSGWATTAPALDGSIAPGEWADATTLDIGIGLGAVNVFVMNDADYLYLAFDDHANPSLDPFDYGGLLFDDEGGTPPLLRDGFWTAANCPSTEGIVVYGNMFIAGFPADNVFQGVSAAGNCSLEAATGVSGAYSAASGHMVYEMRMDLAASPLQASPGETIGTNFVTFDNVLGATGVQAVAPDVLDPVNFHKLTLATPPLDVPTSATSLRTRLEAARPNPFGGSTELRFALREAGAVRIEVFNVLGQRVTSLVDGTMNAGEHFVRWDGRGAGGRPVTDGLYYVRMRAGEFDETRAMVRMR